MTPRVKPVSFRLATRVIRVAAWLVPRPSRRTWRSQWQADLHAQWIFLAAQAHRSVARDLLTRTLGAVIHACVLRFRSWTMTDLLADVRYGARTFVKRPGFAVVAVLLLALGIGATTTIFSWVEGFVLRPLPGVADASTLVMVNGTTKTRRDISLSYPNFADLSRQKPSAIAGMAAARMVAVNVRVNQEPERAWAELVTGEFFAVLGVGPSAGRVLTPDDDRQPGGHPVVVVSHAFWQRQLGGDTAVVGRTMAVNGKPFTIIGVAAEEFRGGGAGLRIDLWVPMMMQRTVTAGDRLVERGNAWLQVLARLSPGATLAQAQSGLSLAAVQLAKDYPGVNTDRGVALSPLWRAPNTASSILGPVLAVLLVVVGLVLLIVCANLASLMLARAAGRQREIAVRLALGASRVRIVRQLLTESLLLSGAGAALGLLCAVWGSQMFTAFIPPTPQPITGELSLTARVPLVGMGLMVVTTVLFGLLPALQATRTTLVPALKDSRGSIGGRRRTRVRSGLVVAQVALSMVLLVAAGLFTRTLQHSQAADVGFDLDEGLLASLDVLPAGYDAARGTRFYRDLLADVRALPGVEAAGLARDIPLKLGAGSDTSGDIEGYEPAKDEEIVLYYDRVSPGFLPALGVPLREGREFGETDDADHAKVVVINETMARRYWKGRSAVGGRIHLGEWYTVVGVVGDVKYSTLNAPPVSFIYLPLYASYRPDVTLLVRTAGAPASLIPGLRAAVARLNPDLPLFDVRTMAEHRHQVTFIAAIAASLLGAFGGVALLLATVGLYGLLGFVVSQRTPEIGLRVALGAQRSDIRRLIGSHGLRLTAAGTLLGVTLAVVLMPLLRSQLLGVSATDGLTYAAAALVLLVGASCASYLPARRAARVDPLTALRDE